MGGQDDISARRPRSAPEGIEKRKAALRKLQRNTDAGLQISEHIDEEAAVTQFGGKGVPE
jgi:hypothetical protein